MQAIRSNAQEVPLLLEEVYYEIFEDASDEELEELKLLAASPFNINTVREEDIAKFIFLTHFEQKSLWYFIQHNKPIRTIYEIQAVAGLPLAKAQLLATFLQVEESKEPRLPHLIKSGRHSYNYSLQLPLSDALTLKDDNNYAGPALKQVARYRFSSYNKLQWGATLKNDIGEQYSLRNPLVVDYASAYFRYEANTILHDIVVGDYELRIGQGLTFWQGGYYGKNIQTNHIHQHASIKPHTSANEIDFNRGAIANIAIKNVRFVPFISYKNIDGKIANDSLTFTFYNTGYHRTENELLYKSNIASHTAGIHSEGRFANHIISSSLVHNKFSKSLMDSTLNLLALNYSYNGKKIQFFSEHSYNFAAWAHTAGVLTRIQKDIELVSAARYYSPEYTNMFAKGAGEQSKTTNEYGLLTRVKVPLHTHVALYVQHDAYAMPHPRYTTPLPTRGNEIMCKIEFQNWDNIYAYYQWKYEIKTMPTQDNDYAYTIEEATTQSHSIYITIPIGEIFYVKSRLQQRLNSEQKGYFMSQEIVYNKKKSWKLVYGYSFVSAPYDLRMYVYESNVTHGLSSLQYFNKSLRNYIILSTPPHRKLLAQCKLYYTLPYEYKYPTSTFSLESAFGAFLSITYSFHSRI